MWRLRGHSRRGFGRGSRLAGRSPPLPRRASGTPAAIRCQIALDAWQGYCTLGHPIVMASDTPELISDDPRKEPDTGPEQIERLINAATEQHGVLIPRNLLSEILGVSSQRVAQLIEQGVFTRIAIASQQFVPLREVMARREQQVSGNLPRGGRGAKGAPLADCAA